MSLLHTKVLPRLEGEYKVTIKSYEETENEKGGYIKVILQLPDREYPYIIFPSSAEYVARNLRNQFGLYDEEVELADVLEQGTKTPFSVWFSYNQDYGMNVAFHDAIPVTEEAPDLD